MENRIIDYEKLDDKMLHVIASTGDMQAMNCLLSRYSNLVSVIASSYFINGGDSDDLFQEGMIGLFSAIRNYDSAKINSFRNFAEICIRRRIISALKSANTSGNLLLNESISLEDEESGNYSFSTSERTVEDSVIGYESGCSVLEQFRVILSEREYQILLQYLEGYSYSDIAKHCGYSVKSVDNALHRIRKKSLYAVYNGDFSNSADAIY